MEDSRLKMKKMMMNRFTSPLWDAVKAVEVTTLSLMTGEKAAALSSAMGELTHVGREVYKEVSWLQYIIGETAIAMKGVVAATLSSAVGEPEHVEHGVYYNIVESTTIKNSVGAAALSQGSLPTMNREFYGGTGAMGELHVGSGVYDAFKEYKHGKVSLPATETIVVVYSVVEECMAVKFAVVEDMMQQGRLTSVPEDNRHYCDRVEVLAERGMMFVRGLSSSPELRGGRVEARGKEAQHEDWEEEQEGQVGERRSLERCRRAASSNSCPGGVLEGVKSLRSSSNTVIICISRPVCACAE